MKGLYLITYFNEMESENDADVLIIKNPEHKQEIFKRFFKNTYDYEIEDKHIIGIYPITDLLDSEGIKYEVVLERVN